MKSGLGPSGDRPVRAHEIRGFLFQAAGHEVHTGVDELLTDRVRSPAQLGHLLVGVWFIASLGNVTRYCVIACPSSRIA